ncbi:hypothetical protein G6F65_019000 [Rhizopus arrhizus]|nr:hypothetical protein G6F65_019000 [Rhizopus arrhizus]
MADILGDRATCAVTLIHATLSHQSFPLTTRRNVYAYRDGPGGRACPRGQRARAAATTDATAIDQMRQCQYADQSEPVRRSGLQKVRRRTECGLSDRDRTPERRSDDVGQAAVGTESVVVFP